MFGRNERRQSEIALEATIKDLRERLEKTERMLEPFRAGELSPYTIWHPHWKDPRPTVTHEEAIQMLLQHCGVEFKAVPGTPARVVLEKKTKKPATSS